MSVYYVNSGASGAYSGITWAVGSNSNNGTSVTTPWASITYAYSQISSGDIVTLPGNDDITSSTTKTEVLGLLTSANSSLILSCVDGRVIYSYPNNDSTDVSLTHTVDSVAVTVTAKTPSAAVGESSEDIVKVMFGVINKVNTLSSGSGTTSYFTAVNDYSSSDPPAMTIIKAEAFTSANNAVTSFATANPLTFEVEVPKSENHGTVVLYKFNSGTSIYAEVSTSLYDVSRKTGTNDVWTLSLYQASKLLLSGDSQYRNLGNFSFKDIYAQTYNTDNWKFEEDTSGNLVFKRYDHANAQFATKKVFNKDATSSSSGVDLTTWKITEADGSLVFKKYNSSTNEYETQYLVSA